MARKPEVAALRAIEDAYQRWTVTSDQLQRALEKVQTRDAAPVQSLRADFDAQLAVTRSVVAFAATRTPDPMSTGCPEPPSSRRSTTPAPSPAWIKAWPI